MQIITTVKPSIKDPIFDNEGNAINEVGSSISKVGKAKSKNITISNFLAKFKLLIESSFGSGFLTSKARLTFAKLKQTFIKTQIFYYFDPKYYIHIKTNTFGYIMSRVFSQLASVNLD